MGPHVEKGQHFWLLELIGEAFATSIELSQPSDKLPQLIIIILIFQEVIMDF